MLDPGGRCPGQPRTPAQSRCDDMPDFASKGKHSFYRIQVTLISHVTWRLSASCPGTFGLAGRPGVQEGGGRGLGVTAVGLPATTPGRGGPPCSGSRAARRGAVAASHRRSQCRGGCRLGALRQPRTGASVYANERGRVGKGTCARHAAASPPAAALSGQCPRWQDQKSRASGPSW